MKPYCKVLPLLFLFYFRIIILINYHFVLLQITVSSGGMLVQKLNVEDLQFEKGSFDGTMVYAQNKVLL